MKKCIHILLLSTFLFSGALAQVGIIRPIAISVQNPMTPLVVLDHFARNYPRAVPFWSMKGKCYTAMFIDPNTMRRHIIVYDRHGLVLRKESEVDKSECPETLQDYYSRHLPGQSFDVWAYDDVNKGKKYYLKRGTREIWFDERGNFVFKKLVLRENLRFRFPL